MSSYKGTLPSLLDIRMKADDQRSHPQLQLLEKILPKSVLHPPRHALTLPYPTSNLKVHTNDTKDVSAPLPHVHYAPVTIKGVTTSTPVDANSKKKIRLGEVRQKRVEAKLKRKVEREGGGKTQIKSKSKVVQKKGAKQSTKPMDKTSN